MSTPQIEALKKQLEEAGAELASAKAARSRAQSDLGNGQMAMTLFGEASRRVQIAESVVQYLDEALKGAVAQENSPAVRAKRRQAREAGEKALAASKASILQARKMEKALDAFTEACQGFRHARQAAAAHAQDFAELTTPTPQLAIDLQMQLMPQAGAAQLASAVKFALAEALEGFELYGLLVFPPNYGATDPKVSPVTAAEYQDHSFSQRLQSRLDDVAA